VYLLSLALLFDYRSSILDSRERLSLSLSLSLSLDLVLDPAINLELDRTPARAPRGLFATPVERNVRCSK
jgi:hypothetical protein